MTWVRQSDDVVEDERTTNAARHLGPNGIGRAVAVLTEFLAYCNRNLTDGYIEPIVAAKLKTDRRPLDVLWALAQPLRNGEPGWLTGNVSDGWQYVDYLATQPSRATVLAARKKDAARKKQSREVAKVKEADVQRVLMEIAEAEYFRLPTTLQAAVRSGMRSDFSEVVKLEAARMELPYTSALVGRAIDKFVYAKLVNR